MTNETSKTSGGWDSEDRQTAPFGARFAHKYAPLALMALLVVSYFAYVRSFGVKILYGDEWTLVPLFKQFSEGKLQLLALFTTPHSQNIPAFPRLFQLTLYFLTDFNNKIALYCSAIFQLAAFLVLVLLAKESLPKDEYRFWRALPLALLMFSFAQHKNILWGQQPAWFMITFFTLLALLLLEADCKQRKTERGCGGALFFACAIGCGIVSSFSALHGLLVWPAGLAYLLVRESGLLKTFATDRRPLLWLICGFFCAAVYLMVVDFGAHQNQQITFSNLAEFCKFIFTNMGAVMLGVGPTGAFWLGIAIYLLILWAVVEFFTSRMKSAYALMIALIAFGISFQVLLFLGRSSFGSDWAFDSHYSAYNLLLLAGLYLCFAHHDFVARHSPLVIKGTKLIWLAFFTVFTLQVTYHGLVAGKDWWRAQWINVSIVAQHQTEPRFKFQRAVIGRYELGAEQADFLKFHRLNIFHDDPIRLPVEIIALVTPPASYSEFSRANPQYREALQRLWDVYSIAQDLQSAFNPVTKSFLFELVRWASGEIREKDHYLHQYLEPYGNQYVQMFEELKSKAGNPS